MAQHHPKIIKNSRGIKCSNCGGEHEFLSRVSDDAKCGTPVAFGPEKAARMAKLLAGGEADITEMPHDSIVILDDSARKLPRGTAHVRLDQEAGGTMARAG